MYKNVPKKQSNYCVSLGFVDLVYEELKDFNLHAKVRKANDIPSQFHYNSNDRIPPILIIPDDGWYLVNHTHDKLPMSKLYFIGQKSRRFLLPNGFMPSS